MSLANNGLHQTRRGGVAAARPVVEARLAGEAGCSPDVAASQLGGAGDNVETYASALTPGFPGSVRDFI